MDSESKTESSVVEDPEKKQPCRPTTSQMVMDTIKSLNMSNGASLEAIKAFIGEYYDANVNFISGRIQRSLENGVEKGLLEQVADGGSMRFKLKKPAGQEIKTKPQVKEVPKNYLKKNPSASDSTEKSTPKGKVSTPSLPQMVVESIKALKMRNGAPVDAISRYMEEHYGVNVKAVTPNLKRFLKTGVQKGVLENTSKAGADGRFKVGKMAEIKTKPQVKEVPKKYLKKNPSASDRTAKSTLKRKISTPPLPQMVIESIKALKMRNGAPVDAISRYMEEHYGVNLKVVTPNLKRFLKTGVQRGVLENTSKAGADGRFKVGKMAEIKSKPQVKEVPKKDLKKNPPASDGTTKSTLKRKISTLSLPQMVVESIKALKMRNGAPVDAIGRYMEEHYGVNLKVVTPNLKRFLKTGVQRGVLENTRKAGADGRFKVGKMAEVKRKP